MTRLNGWQRMWVVLSALYFLLVIFIAIPTFPTQKDIVITRLANATDAIYVYRKANDATFDELDELAKFDDFVDAYHEDQTGDKSIKVMQETWGSKVDFSDVETEYRQQIDALLMDQAKSIGVTLLAWFIPVVAVYLLGFGVAWIASGFRGNRS